MANGAGQAVQQSLGTIDPSSLIGRADPGIVEPRATAMLAQAFRDGVVTADDIVSRIGALGQTKKKQELQLAQEATSPEAQAARAQQLASVNAQGQLNQAKAERDLVLQQYPAVAYFDKLAPAAGITEPKLKDGTPDYPQMEKIGAELALHQSRKGEALTQLENITTQESADGSVLFARTKQGEAVDPATISRLRAQATRTFERQAPGTAIVQPRETAPSTSAPAPVVEPRGAFSDIPVAGAPFQGGISLGPPKQAVAKPVDPTERAKDLTRAENFLTTVTEARQLARAPQVVGALAGNPAVRRLNYLGSMFGIREDQYTNQNDLEIKVNEKVTQMVPLLKGPLSDKDREFLMKSVPKVESSPELWDRYLNKWEEQTRKEIEFLGGQPAGATTAAPATAAPTTTPVKVNSPADAPPTAQFIRAPDGQAYKNPKYRP